MKQDHVFGTWAMDRNGLPSFVYDCNEFQEPAAQHFTTWGHDNTHYHLLGNSCWFGIATNHGQLYLFDPRRGFTLVGGDPDATLPARSSLVTFTVEDQGGTKWEDINTTSSQPLTRRVFGAGYFEKGIEAGPLRIASKILFPAGDDPAMVAECSVENTTNTPRRIHLDAAWNLFHLPLSKSLIVSWNGRNRYQTGGALNWLLRFAVAMQRLARADTDEARRKHSGKITFTFLEASGTRLVAIPRHVDAGKHDPREPSDINRHCKPVVIACIDRHAAPARIATAHPGAQRQVPNARARAIMSYEVEVPAKATVTKRFLLACANEGDLDPLIVKYAAGYLERDMQAEAAAWFKTRAVTLDVPGMPWLERETTWHGTYVLSSMFADEYHGLHRIPQGSAYLLGHAFDGSIRDFCLFSYPLVFMDPALAREFLKLIYTCIDDRGKITYALHGFGKKLVVPGIHNNPSDQYFFVTWATAEYIYMTRDFQFLDEKITIKDGEGGGKELSVKDLLGRLLRYVMSPEIGLGEHGLVRVRDGDWNDGISLMARNRKAFIKDGESTFNSAMLLFSFPMISPLVQRFDPNLAGEMGSMVERVRDAVDKTWNGKWYYRGYDGRGNPLGDETLYLDHHVWLLQNRGLPADKVERLLDSIHAVLVDRSRCGAAIMYPPNPRSSILPPGWDINGGTWHALNSLLAWGLRILDPGNALAFLLRMSMHNRSEQYPSIWYGIWSGPDAYNADDAERPGEAFYHASTPMCDFPFMNNNLHAGFIAAAIRYAGIEAYHDRLCIDVSAGEPFTFKSRLANIKKEASRIEIEPGQAFKEAFVLEVIVPEGFGARSQVDVEPSSQGAVAVAGSTVRVRWSPERPVRRITISRG
ncbi:MAG: hypothetical protein JW839_13725 [Candidatus Lokiarchaeota archaeon]|nr:hypothetical protein [Candidatus Lokiarchaeota archaeon]